MTTIEIFTDGACSSNGRSSAQAGYGLYFPNNEYKSYGRAFIHKPITNQRAELYAIYKALKIGTTEDNKLIIYTDSLYSINCVTKWMKSWLASGWKTKTGKPVKNVDILQMINEIYLENKEKITFVHVKAHTGKSDYHSKGNEQADILARSGVKPSVM